MGKVFIAIGNRDGTVIGLWNWNRLMGKVLIAIGNRDGTGIDLWVKILLP